MNRKLYLWISVLLIALFVSILPAYSKKISNPQHQGFQASTFDALNIGVYEGSINLNQLKKHGDFGLGTYDGLDGEMVLLNGKFYQIKDDGIAYPANHRTTTPFSTVTFFRKEQSLNLRGKATYQELQQQINAKLLSQNLPYAIRIQGNFPYLKVRSVAKQKLPYPLLGEVINKQQKIFEFRNVKGTLVGFRLPLSFKGSNVAGYHFHFITDDLKAGGHLLDGEFLNAIADVETLHDWQIALPHHESFATAKLE
jgi:acetolactate decarboxylase